MKKTYLITFVALLTLTIASCSKEDVDKNPVIRPVQSIVLQKQADYVLRVFPGVIKPDRTVQLSFEIPGKIVQIPHKQGTEVKKGVLLAAIDDHQYVMTLNETKAKLTFAQSQYNRAKKLIVNDYISREDYDKLATNLAIATANYNKAKRDFENTKIMAPFDGIIARRVADIFQYVQAKQHILTFDDVSMLEISIDVPQQLVLSSLDGDHRDQTKIHAIFNATHKGYPLTYKEHRSAAEQDTQTYTVILNMPQPKDLRVLPGMSVSVEIQSPIPAAENKTAFLVPATSLFSNTENQAQVWIINPQTNKVSQHAVTAQVISKNQALITKGVKLGERIVTAGIHQLHAGQEIRIQ